MSAQQIPTSQRALKLSEWDTVRLVELYKTEPVLYNITLPEYRFRELKQAAAERISESLNVPGFGSREVIVKFKNLRSSYCQELKKIESSQKIAKTPEEVYKPTVLWFNCMNSFIRPFVKQRYHLINALQSNDVQITQDEIKVEEPEMQENDYSTYTPPELLYNSTEFSRKWESLPESEVDNNLHPYPQPDCPSNSSELLNRRSSSENEPSKRKKTKKIGSSGLESGDIYDHFGRYVAAMLRTIGNPNAMILQRDITTLLTNTFSTLHRQVEFDSEEDSSTSFSF